ncbi:MAG TPA: RNA polymerase sigma factor [Chloroflexota bacterium]
MSDALSTGAAIEEVSAEAREALLVEAAKQDPNAYGELYERYYARVYRYIYHRLGSVHDAEDLTAVVFMKALEALPTYRTGRNGFAPWVFRITRNAVVDHYRRQRKQAPLDELSHESADSDPVGDVLEREQQIELRTLVECLSPEQRDVVLMRYAADLSFSEIAATLSKNEAAVRMLLHRGLRKMKAVMDDETSLRRN